MSKLLAMLSTRSGQLLVGFFVLLSAVTFSVFLVWDIAARPFSDVRDYAISVAKEHADVQVVDSFAIYNGSETYFSLQGKNSQGVSIAVIIPEASNTVYTYLLESGISKEQAQVIAQENGAGDSEHIILGYRDGKPVWEIKSGTAYYLVEFETGNFVTREGL